MPVITDKEIEIIVIKKMKEIFPVKYDEVIKDLNKVVDGSYDDSFYDLQKKYNKVIKSSYLIGAAMGAVISSVIYVLIQTIIWGLKQ